MEQTPTDNLKPKYLSIRKKFSYFFVIFLLILAITLYAIFHPRIPTISLYAPTAASLFILSYNKGLNIKVDIPLQIKSTNFYAYSVDKVVIKAFPLDAKNNTDQNQLTTIVIKDFFIPPRKILETILPVTIPIQIGKRSLYAHICWQCYKHGNFSVRYQATLHLQNLALQPVYSDIATIPCSIMKFIVGNSAPFERNDTNSQVLDSDSLYKDIWNKLDISFERRRRT
jgi:hypothetical protein